ncbi:MAG: hypothetical protein ACI9DC_001960 [Gammaproteobacteria bacterium]|jgi:hypothetical protein
MTNPVRSSVAQSRDSWLGDSTGQQPRERVRALVLAMSHARWRQLSIDCASKAVFAAVLASIVAVLAIQVGWLPLSPWATTSGLLFLALCIAAGIAWTHRPDELEVAIRADLELNLQQRLSTAWEFMEQAENQRTTPTNDADSDWMNLDEVLAAQAVRARLPSYARVRQMFAVRANTFAVMTPVALIALVLVGMFDPDASNRGARVESDAMVISEGVRLRDYGRRMQARARQRELPRSARQSERVQELGNRMLSGALSRDEALTRLRDLDSDLDNEQRAALNQGSETNVGPLSTTSLGNRVQPQGISAQDMLQQMLDGLIKPGESNRQMLNSDPSVLARSGVSSEELRNALSQFAAGERKALEDVLEKMARSNRAGRDAGELGNAREQIARARESLGDALARTDDEQSPFTGTAQAGQQEAAGGSGRSDASDAFGDDAGEFGHSMPGGRGEGPVKRQQPPENRELRVIESGPTLRAAGQIRDGDVFVSEGRVLPRASDAQIDMARIDAQYTQQLEQVMANERYPLHYKEFIRRYFLNLSEGGSSPPDVRPGSNPATAPGANQ